MRYEELRWHSRLAWMGRGHQPVLQPAQPLPLRPPCTAGYHPGVPPHWVNEPHQELAPALMVVVAGSFLPPTPPRAPPSQVAGLTSSQLRVWWDLLIGFNFSTSFLSSLPAVVLFLLLHLRLHHHHHPSVHHVLSVLVHPHRSL